MSAKSSATEQWWRAIWQQARLLLVAAVPPHPGHTASSRAEPRIDLPSIESTVSQGATASA